MPNNKPAPSSALGKGTSTKDFFNPNPTKSNPDAPMDQKYEKIPYPPEKMMEPMKKIPEGNFEKAVYTPKKVKATQDEADVAKNLGIDPMKFAKKRRGMK